VILQAIGKLTSLKKIDLDFGKWADIFESFGSKLTSRCPEITETAFEKMSDDWGKLTSLEDIGFRFVW